VSGSEYRLEAAVFDPLIGWLGRADRPWHATGPSTSPARGSADATCPKVKIVDSWLVGVNVSGVGDDTACAEAERDRR